MIAYKGNSSYNLIKVLTINNLKIVILILIIIALGIFLLNQFFSLVYHAQLINDPCTICLNQNPEITLCQKIKINNLMP